MISKIILGVLGIALLTIIALDVWSVLSDPVRFQQKQDIVGWVNSCPKDATLSQKSIYHYDALTGGTAIIMIVCKSTKPKNEVLL